MRYGDVISHSIRAASAWLLTLLVALPFTAPFSSCDISMLLGTAPGHHARARVSAGAAATSIEAAATESESGSVLEEEFKDAIIAPGLAGVATDISLDVPDRVEFHAGVTRQPLVALRL
jgi:hypothetical protein